MGLLVRYAVSDALRWRNTLNVRASASADHMVIGVNGMTCGGCVSRLEKALNADPRVQMASVSLDPGQATVAGDLNAQQVADLVNSAGFTAVN